MAEVPSFRRVLIMADESANWIVAGLRQLERLALSVDEFAIENNETAPVLVCILWRPNLDPLQRWVPKNGRLTMVAFVTGLDGLPYDLVLSTRQFLCRKALGKLMEASVPMPAGVSSVEGPEFWRNNFRQVESLPQSCQGAWEYITDESQIDGIERRFVRGSGKSQDGLVSRYLNRPISQIVTRFLLQHPITPNAWTFAIFPIPILATLVLLHGSYWSFLLGLILFQVFSVLDGCDGEIARAKFLESESGRRLDDFFDILSNILLVIGLGFGLSSQANLAGQSGWFWVAEGIAAAVLICVNEYHLATRELPAGDGETAALGGTLYPRHRQMVERSGMLVFGEKFASWLMQLTKRDVAVLFFVFLAAMGLPSVILHLLFGVTAISLALAWRASQGAAVSRPPK